MKKYFFALLMVCLFSFTSFAQDEFKGGQGDGYATNKISFFITSLAQDKKNLNQKVVLYPNPIRQGKQLSIALPPNSAEITGIRIVDKLGRFVYEQSVYNIQQDDSKVVFELQNTLEEGAYTMLLDFAKHTVIKKIVIFD
mgnify:CR=1 FL=1